MKTMIIAFILFISMPVIALVEVIEVPGNDYATIQEAVDHALDGDTILLTKGSYSGTGNRDIQILGKGITIKSKDGPEHCVIDCEGDFCNPHYGFYFSNSLYKCSIVEGITIRRAWGLINGGAIRCEKAELRIENCILEMNLAKKGGGIFALESALTVNKCSIKANQACHGAGIYCSKSPPGAVIIEDSLILSNIAGDTGGGIRLSHSSPAIRHCTFKANTAIRGGGVFFHCSVTLEILECHFEKNSANEGGGIYSQLSISPKIKHCTIRDNLAHISGGGIFCNSSTPEFYENKIIDNEPDNATGCEKSTEKEPSPTAISMSRFIIPD